MILAALAAKGGQKYLEKQADENPTAFLTLVGKIIPLQVTGKDGGPIQHQGINAPAKETREEWLARQAPAVADKTLHWYPIHSTPDYFGTAFAASASRSG